MYSYEMTEKWFKDFVDSFKNGGALTPEIERKRTHSYHVSGICSAIAESLEWDEENDMWLAKAIGLLHAVVRFPQYDKNKTCNVDWLSFDHGDRGAEILKEEYPWSDHKIEAPDIKKVLTAVRVHNKPEIPGSVSLSTYRWCALIRDADKLDIFRMVQKRIDNGTFYELFPKSIVENEVVGVLSPVLVESIRTSGKGLYTDAHSFLDFRLIELSWALDLNFPVSAVTAREEGIFDKIAEDLKGRGVDDIVDGIMEKVAAL